MPDDHLTSSEEHEPDYRFTLANERTFLAWIRTALALLAGSVAIVQLVPDFGISEGRQTVAILMAIISIGIIAGSALRWRSSQQAMRRDAPLPSSFMPGLLTLGVIAIGVLVTGLIMAYGVNSHG